MKKKKTIKIVIFFDAFIRPVGPQNSINFSINETNWVTRPASVPLLFSDFRFCPAVPLNNGTNELTLWPPILLSALGNHGRRLKLTPTISAKRFKVNLN